MRQIPTKRPQAAAFTLIEMLVGMVILGLMVVLCAQIITSTSSTWRRSEQRSGAFQGARFAFESLTLALSQATLNPYWDYVDNSGNRRTEANKANFIPTSYLRASDLCFVITPAPAPPAGSGPSSYTPPPFTLAPTGTTPPFSPKGTDAVFFQVPSGYATDSTLRPLGNLLNSVGYLVQFGSDQSWRPTFLNVNITPYKYRYRLMQMTEPSGTNSVYSSYDTTSSSTELASRWSWITKALSVPANVRPVADNIVAFLVIPRDPTNTALSPDYLYDSRYYNVGDTNSSSNYVASAVTHNQLPPFVEVIMIAIDEPSAIRLAAAQAGPTTAPDLGVGNLFKQVANLDADLATLEATLVNQNISYRIFRTTVRIDSSRWSP